MQPIIVEKPYRFVSPHRGSWLPYMLLRIGRIHTLFNRFAHGIVSHECRHVERLRESIKAGHGIVIAPNHTRTADPAALCWLGDSVPCLFYGMASWHLYNYGWFSHWLLRTLGAFSVNREGVDRQAIDTAIDVLVKSDRPLVIFPEGYTSRMTDRLLPLLDGIALVARMGARKRAARGQGQVIVHPVAIKYHLLGDLEPIADRALTEIELRLGWQPQRQLPLLKRVTKVGEALLALKELEYLGETRSGSLVERQSGLVERLLVPLEEKWFGKRQAGPPITRIRALRIRILPDMIPGHITAEERARRWHELEALYVAQHLSANVTGYLATSSVDRIFESIEKLEEDLTDTNRHHPPLHCVVDVGEGIVVSSERNKQAGKDPLLEELGRRLQSMLDKLATESRLLEPNGPKLQA